MRFVVLLFLALFLVTPSHAQEAPNLAFLSEYIRELGVNERMRALGEREVTAVDANSRFPAIIRSSTRIQSELGAQIRTLSGIHLKPPFEDLTTKITQRIYRMHGKASASWQCRDGKRLCDNIGALTMRFGPSVRDRVYVLLQKNCLCREMFAALVVKTQVALARITGPGGRCRTRDPRIG